MWITVIVVTWIAMGLYSLFDDWYNLNNHSIKLGDVLLYTIFGPVIFAAVLQQRLPSVFKKIGNITIVKGKSK